MKTPEDIARDLISAQPQRPGALGFEIVLQRDVLAAAIAAAIVAERAPGTTGHFDMPIESDTYDPPEASAAPTPACSRCGGSGEVIAARSSWTQPDDDDREPDPCPECRGKP